MAYSQEEIDFLKSLNAAGINSRDQFISAMQPSGMLTSGGVAPSPATAPQQVPEQNREVLRYLVNQGFDAEGIRKLNEDNRVLLDYRDYTPTGERTSNDQNDFAAQAFYQFIHDNPDVYDHLNPTEQSQYQYLRYVNGEISGNNKDDQIKRVRQNAGLPQDQYDGEARYIWRNKPIAADRNDGITAGDAFGIGAYSQRDTGNDGGLLGSTVTNIANASLPGFSVADLVDPLAPVINPIADVFNSPAGTALLTAANLAGGLGYLGQTGMTVLQGANAANIASNTAQGAQSDPVGDAENGPYIGATPVGSRPGWHWERNTDPNAVGEWIAVKDDPTLNTGGSSSSNQGGTPSGEQQPSGGSGTPSQGEQEQEDTWVWTGSVLVNTSTGARQEVPNPGRMETGATYNGDGEKIGDPQQQKEELSLGGLPWDFGLEDTTADDTTAGDTTSGSSGDGNGGLSTGGPPSTGGGSVPDDYPDTDGDGKPGPGPGPYPGDGSGEGEGDGLGGGVGGIGGGLLGGGGKGEYQEYMSGINYLFQNLDRLNISSTDYVGMLIGSLQNDVPGIS